MEYFSLHMLYISSLGFISIGIIFGKWQIAYCIHSMSGFIPIALPFFEWHIACLVQQVKY